MEVVGLCSQALCSKLLRMKWIAWTPVRVWHCLKAVHLPLPFLIIPYYIFHYFPNGFCSASEAVVSFISPVSLSALSTRDEALGPVYPSCFVDYCCFLFTGRESLLNLLPSHRYLHYPPSSRFLLVCHVTLTPCSPSSHCV